jgi:hypothetical protein
MRLLKEIRLNHHTTCNRLVTHRVLVCDSCGWWRVLEIQDEYETYNTDDWYVDKVGMADAVAENFDVGAIETPVEVLRRYLARRFIDIRHIHHRKLEEIMADVIRDFFDCEVRLTSPTRDGGYDIYAVISDKPYLIEVKQRTKPDSVEGVGVVRSLLGVMLLNNIPNGMLISTADSFSREATNAASRAAGKVIPHTIRLLDYSLIYDLFRKTDTSDESVMKWVQPILGKLWFWME